MLTIIESKSTTIIAPTVEYIPIYDNIVTIKEHGTIIGKLQVVGYKNSLS